MGLFSSHSHRHKNKIGKGIQKAAAVSKTAAPLQATPQSKAIAAPVATYVDRNIKAVDMPKKETNNNYLLFGGVAAAVYLMAN